MAQAYEVVQSVVWLNTRTGAKASIYGAVPWLRPQDKADWTTKQEGWTVRNPNTGQVGIGRPPCATFQEAEALAKRLGRPSSIGLGD